MAIGTSGNQFKNAGVAGRLMRELIEAGESKRDTDLEPLDFQLKRTVVEDACQVDAWRVVGIETPNKLSYTRQWWNILDDCFEKKDTTGYSFL